jgi:hypothetical protein
MFADLTIDIVDTNNKVIESLYKKEPKSEGPPSNLILSTKIQTATPFIVRVTLDDKGKKEEYRGEIKSLEAGVYEPIKLENTKLERVIVEVRH